mmetsp:Transcript_24428/g.37874  ORF Transcript_24428/g.37874 Transcript_24428/m.37874 type:complete len:123 (+) Transcript_24428:473-841(+)
MFSSQEASSTDDSSFIMMDEYVVPNRKFPDYLERSDEASVLNLMDDYWVKTECFYLTDHGKVRGALLLSRNGFEFISYPKNIGNIHNITGGAADQANRLKKLDEELFEAEITKMLKKDPKDQ